MADNPASDPFYHKSPLDNLVRQSSRRAQNTSPLKPDSTSIRHRGSQALHRAPSSPLLHTRFHASVSTMSTNFMDLRGEDEGYTMVTQGSHSSYNESVYSDTSAPSYVVDPVRDESPTLPPSITRYSPTTTPERDRQSWSSHGSDTTVQMDGSTPADRDTQWSDTDGTDSFSFRQHESPTLSAFPVPMLVVSSPTYTSTHYESPEGPSQPRPSATQYNISNFSRPIRYPSVRHEQSKQKVLERNRSPQAQQQQRYTEFSLSGDEAIQRNDRQENYLNDASSPPIPRAISSTPPNISRVEHTTPATSHSQGTNIDSSSPSEPALLGRTRSPSPHSLLGAQPPTPENTFPGPLYQSVRLPNSPPSPRTMSRTSLYSAYSYYQLDGSRSPSPSSPPIEVPDTSNSEAALTPTTSTHSRPSPSPIQPRPLDPTPDDFLLLGIQHHEANRLTESASCFERAATMDGGSGVGMLMWGLSLRHAWGTPKDEKAAFRWLRRAAEVAVGDLESARNGIDQKAVKVCFNRLPRSSSGINAAMHLYRQNLFLQFMRSDSVSSMDGAWHKIRRWL